MNIVGIILAIFIVSLFLGENINNIRCDRSETINIQVGSRITPIFVKCVNQKIKKEI